jgi:hypothetical protein
MDVYASGRPMSLHAYVGNIGVRLYMAVYNNRNALLLRRSSVFYQLGIKPPC